MRCLRWVRRRPAAVLVIVLLAANFVFTARYVDAVSSHQQAVAATQQALAAKAAEKAAMPLCRALLHLSQITGSHGDSGATYGLNLETGFQQVYAATSCPQIMRGRP